MLTMHFPVSGVETSLLLPPAVSLFLSFFTSMGGVSGAFLLLPFQMSVLGYTSPSVSATNHVFNVVAIPSGVLRYIRDGRMAWPLTWVVIAGTLPGVFFGFYARIRFMPDPRTFKLFAGCVLFYIGYRLAREVIFKGGGGRSSAGSTDGKFRKGAGGSGIPASRGTMASVLPDHAVVRTLSVSLKRVEYEFWGDRFSFSTMGMFFLALVVGLVGGAYGIGGGSIIAPFCVTVFRLPVYTVAGAALMGTCITSFAAVLFSSLVPVSGSLAARPDWALGLLFGAGGFVGMYFGARCQKYFSQGFIKGVLAFVILSVAIRYIGQYFLG